MTTLAYIGTYIGAGSILNVRGQELVQYARAQNFKPRPLINGNAFVTLMAKMKKQRWIIGKKQSISRRAAKKLA